MKYPMNGVVKILVKVRMLGTVHTEEDNADCSFTTLFMGTLTGLDSVEGGVLGFDERLRLKWLWMLRCFDNDVAFEVKGLVM